MKKQRHIALMRLTFIVCLLFIWEATTGGFGSRWQIFEPMLLAPPSEILRALVDYAQSGLLLTDAEQTLLEAFLGLLFGMIGGMATGILFGYWRTGAAVIEPVMVAMNSLPRITVAPILIIWFGLGMTSKVLLSLFTVFFVIFFNTYAGVKSVNPDLIKAVKVMGGERRHTAWMVVVPSVCSWVFAALRTSVSFALTGAVVGEFVGSSSGLGYRMLLATGLLDTPRVFAIMLILMAVGTFLVTISSRLERYLLQWNPGFVGR